MDVLHTPRVLTRRLRTGCAELGTLRCEKGDIRLERGLRSILNLAEWVVGRGCEPGNERALRGWPESRRDCHPWRIHARTLCSCQLRAPIARGGRRCGSPIDRASAPAM